METPTPGHEKKHTPAHVGPRGARAWRRAPGRAWLVAILGLGAVPLTHAGAQMPMLPVLQNGLVGPGTAIAIDGGVGGGSRAVAGAVSWGPRSGRFQIVGGGGVFEAATGDYWPGYGARVAIPLRRIESLALGIAAFVGIGGGRRDSTSMVRVPAGVAVGWQHPLGATRSISLYAAPFYSWARASVSGRAGTRRNGASVSAGVDLALAPSFGVTVGFEAGARSLPDVTGGGGLLAAGISYAFR